MTERSNDTPGGEPALDPGLVKHLRRLVTVLTATMIIGFIVIVALFVTRFSGGGGPDLPTSLRLPDGAAPMAFTQGSDWIAVVTEEDEILIYDRLSGKLRQRVTID